MDGPLEQITVAPDQVHMGSQTFLNDMRQTSRVEQGAHESQGKCSESCCFLLLLLPFFFLISDGAVPRRLITLGTHAFDLVQ